MNQHIVTWEKWLNRWWMPLLITGIIINLLGIFSTIIEPDGALYATIAKTMVASGDYFNLMFNGKDWLDKPHFPFWLMALSFKLFGVNTFSYKLPALLFWGLGAFYTYKFAETFYPSTIAKLATLIYLTATHLIISNNDVRAEPYLTGLIIGGVYHFYKSSIKKEVLNLIAASLLVACAIMTKGIFILIIIASGLVIHWISRKEWANLFKLKWISAGILIILFILPELYSLYFQFDLHPEKTVFGTQHVSGVQFFFWGSQFGRFFNSGPIKGDGDPFLFLHTTLWAYFPWSLLFFVAIYWRFKNYRKDMPEFICLGTTVIAFLLFSLSRFQLPHYLNVIFPFMSILSAQYLYTTTKENPKNWWRWIFYFQTLLAFGLVILLISYYQPEKITFILVWTILSAGIILVFMNAWRTVENAFGQNFLGACMIFGFLNIFFFPDLLHYQSGSEAVKFLRKEKIHTPVVMLDNDSSPSFDFYYPSEVPHYSFEKLRQLQGNFLVFCHERFVQAWKQKGYQLTILKTFQHYPISGPRGPFINHKTRADVIEHFMLVRLHTPIRREWKYGDNDHEISEVKR